MPQDSGGSEVVHFKPGGPLDCSDGQVLHDWCLGGWGIAWRSTWEVEAEIAAGRLVAVLESLPPPNGILRGLSSAQAHAAARAAVDRLPQNAL
jgi:DNA-binding transcriptional LysR family regulator